MYIYIYGSLTTHHLRWGRSWNTNTRLQYLSPNRTIHVRPWMSTRASPRSCWHCSMRLVGKGQGACNGWLYPSWGLMATCDSDTGKMPITIPTVAMWCTSTCTPITSPCWVGPSRPDTRRAFCSHCQWPRWTIQRNPKWVPWSPRWPPWRDRGSLRTPSAPPIRPPPAAVRRRVDGPRRRHPAPPPTPTPEHHHHRRYYTTTTTLSKISTEQSAFVIQETVIQ